MYIYSVCVYNNLKRKEKWDNSCCPSPQLVHLCCSRLRLHLQAGQPAPGRPRVRPHPHQGHPLQQPGRPRGLDGDERDRLLPVPRRQAQVRVQDGVLGRQRRHRHLPRRVPVYRGRHARHPEGRGAVALLRATDRKSVSSSISDQTCPSSRHVITES